MAISYVGGVVAGRTGNSNSTVDVSLSSGLAGGSNSGVSAGDLVVVTVCTGSAARASVVAVTAPATYNNLTAQRTTATTYDTNVQVSYKFMPATPDSVVTIPAQGNAADGQSYAVQVFRGVDPSTPLDVTPTYATGSGTNNNPNPAAITPVTAGTWIVVCGGGAAANGTTLFTTGTLTDFLTENGADTNDATVGAGYYDAWTSGAYDPAAFGGGSANAANSWGATTIALRPAPVSQSLTPTLYENGQTFYAPTITVGAVALTATLYENTNSFYTHEVTQPAASQNLTATLYENSNTFYAAQIDLALNATRYDNSNTFYDATVGRGVVTLTVDLFTNDNTFHSATVDRGSVTLSASLYGNTNDFYTASITHGGVVLQPDLFTNSNAFYTHSLAVGAVELTPILYSNTNSFYAASVAVGAVTLNAELFTNSNTFYQHSLNGVAGSQDLTPSLFTNSNVFYTATVDRGAVSLTAELFTNTNQFYAPSLSVGGVTLSLEIFVNNNTFYSPVVASLAAQDLIAELFSNTNSFYTLQVAVAALGHHRLQAKSINVKEVLNGSIGISAAIHGKPTIAPMLSSTAPTTRKFSS